MSEPDSNTILECDEGCLYTMWSARNLPSTKANGIPRCVRHGAILDYAMWAHGMTIEQARKTRREEKRS